jgi:hypothetical protein
VLCSVLSPSLLNLRLGLLHLSFWPFLVTDVIAQNSVARIV